jgi:hypothetical protein
MADKRGTIEIVREIFILVVGVLGLVLTVVGLFTDNVGAGAAGVIFVVASIMGEGLSHFAVGP